MDERRDPPPAAGRPRLVAAHTGLTPPQEAWAAYTRHAIACSTCADIDRTCTVAGELYRAWVAISRVAFRRLADGSA